MTVFSVDREIFFSETEEGDLLPGTWAELSNVTKGLWISLCYHSSFNDDPCVSQKELADVTGCSVAQVKKSIAQLKECGLILSSNIVIRRDGKSSYRYSLKKNKSNKKVDFHPNVFRGRAWNFVCPTSQALYPILKACSQEISATSFETMNGYKNSCDYTVCVGEPGALCVLAGFGGRSYKKACSQLVAVRLLEKVVHPIQGWGVLSTPNLLLDSRKINEILSINKRKELMKKIFQS